jgi:hypothetical protein
MRLDQFRLAAFAWLSLLLTSTAHAQAPQPATAPATNGPYRIAGTVVDAKTGFPLALARVTIAEARNEQNVQSTISSDDGHFEFHAAAGKFSLSAAKRGYITSYYNQHDQFWIAIVTGAGIDTEHLILRVTPSAVLTGTVMDENGDPVRDASISVYREDHYSGVSRILRARSAQTDDQGVYEVPGLNSGTYFVSVQARPWYAVHAPPTNEGVPGMPTQVDTSLDVAYPVTYYGDVTESDEATPIPVRGGDHLQADIHLNPVPALHLLFHVADNGERGLTVPQLQRPAFDDMEGVPNSGIQQVSPGVFEITGVPAGSYTVRMPDSEGQLRAPIAVNLAGSQELTGDSGSPTGRVTLNVTLSGAAKLPTQIQVGLRNSKGHVAPAQVDEKGVAQFDDLIPGKYDVIAWTANTAYYVLTMTTASGSVSGHTLNLTPGSSLTASISLVGGSVRVDGFAKRAGKAAPGAMIVLVPKNPEANPDRFRRDQSDLDGSFSFYDVPPGSYTVIAIQDGWDLDWAKPAVLARYEKHGQPLVVDAKTRGTQHLPNPVEVEPR